MVDLTIRKLLEDEQLNRMIEQARNFCESIFIDKKFLKALCKILRDHAINLLRDKHYRQMQYMIQEFCYKGDIL